MYTYAFLSPRTHQTYLDNGIGKLGSFQVKGPNLVHLEESAVRVIKKLLEGYNIDVELGIEVTMDDSEFRSFYQTTLQFIGNVTIWPKMDIHWKSDRVRKYLGEQ